MKIAVVIPCYRVKTHILGVLKDIGADVDLIYVVDDACPEKTGQFVRESAADPRVKVLFHSENQGVGGAMVTGYKAALADGADIVVKLDGDHQMDPRLIPRFVDPIAKKQADYTKGNRFFRIANLSGMPNIRLFGNAALSLVSKLSSGYWNVMDPTNGFTAAHSSVLSAIDLEKLDRRYFFESDMLFRLGVARAVVKDVPMEAVYGSEKSGLRISRVLFEFPPKYLIRFLKRIFYSYFLRDFNYGTLQLLLGGTLFLFGFLFGAYHFYMSSLTGIFASPGTVMLGALPMLLGFQSLIAAMSFDVSNVPARVIQDEIGEPVRSR